MRFFERLRKEIFSVFRFEKWCKQGLMYLSCGFYFQTERWIDMPRMSKKQKQKCALILNDRNRITYNELCRKCRNDCKQSFCCIVMLCPKYVSKGRTKKNDWKWNNCQRTSWSCQGKWNRAQRSEMAMVSIYSVWQGYAVAVQSRRWKKSLSFGDNHI